MLMDQARQQKAPQQPMQEQGQEAAPTQAGFTPPDWKQFTPPELVDTVERIVAAGAKLMYSPDMRDELKAGANADMPADKKLAENAAGLLLVLDQKAKGGLPVEALFPAALGLMGECVAVMQAAGQPVTQEDYNDAALNLFAIIGKKLGGSDEDIMAAGQKMGLSDGGEGGGPAEQQLQDPQAQAAMPPDDEDAAMAQEYAA